MCSFLRWGQDTEVLFRRPSFLIAVIRALVLARIPQSSQRREKELSKDLDAKLLAGDGNTHGVKLAAGF